MKAHSPLSPISIVLYALLALFSMALLGALYESGSNYTLYRFATQFALGNGLHFGTFGLDVTTYPLAALILGILHPIGVDVSVTGLVLNAISAGVGAYFLVRRAENDWLIGVIYCFGLCWQPSPMLTLMLALALAGQDALRHRRFLLSGVLLGAATLSAPHAALLAVLLLSEAVRLGAWPKVRRFAASAALIPLVGLLLLNQAYPNAYVTLILPEYAVLILPLMAGVGLVRSVQRQALLPDQATLIVWGALLVLIAVVQGRFPDAAVLPALILAAAAWRGALRVVILGALALDFALMPILSQPRLLDADDPSAAAQAGAWIAENTTDSAVIATYKGAELAYAILPRRVVDLSRQLAPFEIDRFWMIRYAPDVVVLRDDQTVAWPNFSTTYAQVQQFEQSNESMRVNVYQRVIEWAALDNHGVEVNFMARFGRDDLRLLNVAIGNELKGGQLVRVRLDWQIRYTPNLPIRIKLNLLGADGIPIGGITDELPPEVWQTGTFKTYHAFALPNDLPSGPLRVFLGVEMNAGSLGELQVAEVQSVPQK